MTNHCLSNKYLESVLPLTTRNSFHLHYTLNHFGKRGDKVRIGFVGPMQNYAATERDTCCVGVHANSVRFQVNSKSSLSPADITRRAPSVTTYLPTAHQSSIVKYHCRTEAFLKVAVLNKFA